MIKSFKSRSLRVELCGKYANHFEGQVSGLHYIHRLFCYDVTCPTCGKVGGHIHKRRKELFIDKVKKHYGCLEGLGLRKFVFTLPSEVRADLLDRGELNLFMRIVEKVVKPFYSGRLIGFSFHLFGDKDADYKPHINVYVVERLNVAGGCKMKIDKWVLATIKKKYLAALLKKGFMIDDVVLHYGFTLKMPQFFHGVKYFTRPCPCYDLLMQLSETNPSLYAFLLSEEMKGFQFIRWGRCKVDADQFQDGEGVPHQIMEKLDYLGREKFEWERFIDEWRVYERVEIRDGVYACRAGGLSPADKAYLKSLGLLDDLRVHN